MSLGGAIWFGGWGLLIIIAVVGTIGWYLYSDDDDPLDDVWGMGGSAPEVIGTAVCFGCIWPLALFVLPMLGLRWLRQRFHPKLRIPVDDWRTR